MTLLSQPTRQEERLIEGSPEAKQQFIDMLEAYFLPAQHIFMALAFTGLVSAVHSLWTRWDYFKTFEFSPAHVAFCFPTLSHANAIQAYRASVNAFSNIPPESLFKKILFVYWCIFLVGGTILNLIFTYKYVVRLPQWTMDIAEEEEELPAPSDTIVHEMMEETGAHETIFQAQPFVSPAVMEASESGVLVRVPRGTEAYRVHGPFKRTRKVTSLGFDMILTEMELRNERAELLDWVAKNAPRQRNRTMSLPGVFRNVYGTFQGGDNGQGGQSRDGHTRSKTSVVI